MTVSPRYDSFLQYNRNHDFHFKMRQRIRL